jgi:hypothetical protein
MTTDSQIQFADDVQAATDREYAGVRATARKAGRNPRYPFVPVLIHSAGGVRGQGRTEQIRGAAYATRAAAVDMAEQALWDRRVAFTRQLGDPRQRALRTSRGLPRDVPKAAVR